MNEITKRTIDEYKNSIMEKYNYSTRQMVDMCNAEKLTEELGYNQDAVDFIKNKYMSDDKIYKCVMSKDRIMSILTVETERQSKKDRCRFVGE